jgi:nitrate reductase gamma subunit
MTRLTIFWIVHLVGLGVFFGELGLVGSIWLRGRVPGLSPEASRPRKLAAILGSAVGIILSRRIFHLLGVLLRDGIFHLRLLRESRLRWSAHILAFMSFFLLGLLSVVTGFVVEILIPLFGVHHPATDVLANVDHPITALLNEALGLALMLGLAFILYRRYVQKDPQLRSIAEDNIMVVLLALITVSGYPLEAFRLLAEEVPAGEAVWGFLGFGLAELLRPLHWPWEALHYGLFFGHVALSIIMLLYLPFSKLFHMVMSPLIVAINALEEVQ